MATRISSSFVLWLGLLSCSNANYVPKWESLDSRPLPSWYDDVKIGIFLHWGVFSVPSFGSEWFWSNWQGKSKGYVEFMTQNYKPGFSYQEFGPLFTAEFFDPDEWADVFEASGAKTCLDKMATRISFSFVLWLGLLSCSNANYVPNWESLDSRPLPSWFDDAKIGIFLHWGLFSVPSFGSEWFWAYWKNKDSDYVKYMTTNFKPGFEYQDFGPMFTAEFYEPQELADLFQASGAKYIVLTSKHHEGFTLWPSKVSWNWNAKDIGPKRNLLGDLAAAIRNKTDLHFGVYHSMYEWFNPLYLTDKANKYKTQYFVDGKTMPELIELVTQYQPEVIWSDGDWEASDTYWKSKEFLAWLYNTSPVKDVVVVNDRWGSGIPCKHGGYYTCTDRFNPKTLQAHKWENAMTLDKQSWGFRRNADLGSILTIEELITTLAETVSCGGNLLINVGPTHDGRIVPIFQERLQQLGSWLKVNGEGIYSTKPWTAQNDTLTPGVWYTAKEPTVYAVVLSWPKDNVLTLGSLQVKKNTVIHMLGVDAPLPYKVSSKTVSISFPTLTPSTIPCQWAWVLKVTQEAKDTNDI